MGLKRTARSILPASLWRAGSDAYWSWHNRGQYQARAWFSPRFRESQRILQGYQNRYAGKRCFILGNGPSLKDTDLSFLKNEFTFGLNRIYLHFPEIGFPTSFLVVVNTLVLEQCAQDFKALDMPRFITWRGHRWLQDDPEIIFVDTDYTPPETFSENACGRMFEGSTVTYTAMQLAYHMGFSDVILLGVDHSFSTAGPANKVVVSEGEDPNHFSADYFGKGFRWQLPDLEASERAYRKAKEAFERDGRKIRDATIGGKLEVFPKVLYKSLFGGSSN